MHCERKHCKMMRFVFLVCALAASIAASPLTLRTFYNPRIVGGQNAEPGQFPYQISLRISGSHYCGGTILNKNWILSTANCLKGWPLSELQVAVGSILLDDPFARVYPVAETIIHENYEPYDIQNDIGLIRVAEDIEFDDYVQPCELETEDIGADVLVTLSGWGRMELTSPLPEILQCITVKTISLEECQSRHYSPVIPSEICTLTQYGEGACNGDAGGALVRDGKVCGIVSWGTPCGIGFPDVHTRVSSYVDWINEKINNSFVKF